jgi:iron complex transport system substrate-binding protein
VIVSRVTAAAVVAASLVVAACGSPSEDGSSRAHGRGVEGEAPGRVVALGEEFLLADLLALGIEPVASTATVVDAGFLGVDEFDTSGIEALSGNEPDFERLATFAADTLVTTQFVIDEVGREPLAANGDLVVLPDDADPERRLEILAETFGREREADELLAELDAARERARAAIESNDGSCVVSVATVYPSQLAVWVAGPINIPQALLDLGCTLVPTPAEVDPAPNGRAYISLEQLGLLDAPTLVVMQSDEVEGETIAYRELTQGSLWQTLPAVEAGRVIEVDRLGYPGVPGQIRLFDDLGAALGG